MVYLMVSETAQVCKIGWSVNPHKRLNEIRTGRSDGVELAGILKVHRKHEKYLHEKFSEFWLQGEWFRLDPAIVKYFAENEHKHPLGEPLPSKSHTTEITSAVKVAEILNDRFEAPVRHENTQLHRMVDIMVVRYGKEHVYSLLNQAMYQ